MKFNSFYSEDIYGCGYRGQVVVDENGVTTNFVDDCGILLVESELPGAECFDYKAHNLDEFSDDFEKKVLETLYPDEKIEI